MAAGLDALPVTRLHRPARDTRRPAAGIAGFYGTGRPARLLKAAAEAAGENGDPRRLQEFEAVVSAQGLTRRHLYEPETCHPLIHSPAALSRGAARRWLLDRAS